MTAQLSWYGSSRTPEWYTEAHVIERVVRVLGAIDLDPCSNPPPYTVPATRHFTRDEGGLTPPWGTTEQPSTVYMNPPYGRALPVWMHKLADEIRRGRVRAAITLTPARTGVRWFGVLWTAAALCFVQDRVYTTMGVRPPFSSVIGYFGPHAARFADVFGDVGKVVYP